MKRIVLLCSLLIALVISITSTAQSVAINNDGSVPDASSILDLKSTDKGLLIPRMSKTQRTAIVNPSPGLMVYQNAPDSTGLYLFTGTSWKLVFTFYEPAGGDLTGTYPKPSIATGAVTTDKIADNAVTTAKVLDASITMSKLGPDVVFNGGPPSGPAGGDLQGAYPNPSIANGAVTTNKLANTSVTSTKIANTAITTTKIADNAVTTAKIIDAGVTENKLADAAVTTNKVADGSITSAKMAPGVIPTSVPPGGAAGGDLAGTYPNPTVGTGVITTTKIADASVTSAKLAAGVIPTSLPPNGAAGGDLTGSYPAPTITTGAVTTTKIADNAITTLKILDASVTSAKLAAGVIPTSLPPNGAAGGDLTGSYPAPTITTGAVTTTKIADNAITTLKILDASVTSAKLAPGVIPTSLPPNGVAGGDLTGSYPAPTITTGAVTTTKIADGSVTAIKMAPGVIPTSLPPNGTASGDLSGTYPSPVVASGAITNAKLADGAVTTTKIVDASVTSAKLAAGVIPASLPPTGAASGDLSGTYPSPIVNKLLGITINNTVPVNGQVLKYNGTQWIPSADNAGITLPYINSLSSAQTLLALTNPGTGGGVEGINSSTTTNAFGVQGSITSVSPGTGATGVRGINNGTGTTGTGIWGSHAGGGIGVYGSSATGNGVQGNSTDGVGVFGTSVNNSGGYFDIANTASGADAIFGYNAGLGSGATAISENGNGMWGITFSPFSAGVLGYNIGGGEAITGRNTSSTSGAVVGRNDGTHAGVHGIGGADGGTGVLAVANVDGFINGNALVASIDGTAAGNPAVFKANGANVARIDHTGRGYFNNGTVNSGADLAEFFDVEGNRNTYETGDVLVISQTSDRKVEKSTGAYSTLVAGVYATKPGIMLTEKIADQAQLDEMVPMGVIGVIPTKVCTEGGPIKRGDLIVTSSIPGVAMKADPDKVKIGQVLGKALQDYSGAGVGKINVLVNIK